MTTHSALLVYAALILFVGYPWWVYVARDWAPLAETIAASSGAAIAGLLIGDEIVSAWPC